MSEIYRQMRDSTAPQMPEDGKCDYGKTPGVDDCRGQMCDKCEKEQTTRKVNDMKDHDTLDMMQKCGGSFVRAIAQAARLADPQNYCILKSAFSRYWTSYEMMAEAARQRKQAEGNKVSE